MSLSAWIDDTLARAIESERLRRQKRHLVDELGLTDELLWAEYLRLEQYRRDTDTANLTSVSGPTSATTAATSPAARSTSRHDPTDQA